MELHRFLVPRSHMILPYLGNTTEENRVALWKLVDESKVPVILLVAHVAVQSDGRHVFGNHKLLAANEFDDLRVLKTRKATAMLPHTLFRPQTRYAVCIIDELHAFRGRRIVRQYVSALIAKSAYTIGVTVTPIITTPQDLTYQARLLRIPQFGSEAMEALRKEFGRVKVASNKDRKASKARLQVATAATHGWGMKHVNEDPVKAAIDKWVGHQRSLLGAHILRRTTMSLGPDGQPISNLKAYHQKYIACQLREDEMAVQNVLVERLREEGIVSIDKTLNRTLRGGRYQASVCLGGAVGGRVLRRQDRQCALMTQGLASKVWLRKGGGDERWGQCAPMTQVSAFYLKVRRALLHKCLGEVAGHTFAEDCRARPYAENPSTKISMAVEIVKYHVNKTSAPALEPLPEGGFAVPTEVPEGWLQPENAGPDK
ncbi:hypothetical protein L226DRAFT_526634, partial [Lentinus tigrinus ALCF2SS1-7]|uniref:uncharacterized protein n=1 Tax=Lentinus tigrinus ALCF2SS1-7 TaxID=1328758 RepID=UPI0011660942